MQAIRPAMGLAAAAVVVGLSSAALVPAQDEGPWTTSTLKHRAIEDFDYVLGQERWRKLGSEVGVFDVEFPIELLGPMRFEIDSNGDGTPDEDIKGAVGFADLKGKTEDGTVFHYGVRFRNDGERKWSWTTSGAMMGKINGLKVAIIDANANGSYDDYGVDGLVIGSNRGAGYVSRIVNLGGDLFELEVSEDGTEIKTRPWTGETGTLQLGKITGVKAKVSNAIFKKGRDVAFELSSVKGGMVVPAGDYTLDSAFLERGSETARVRAGRRKPIAVEAGAEVKFAWGGPLVAEAPAPTVRGGKATLSPALKIYGESGEEYYEFLPKGKVPSFELTDANTGKRLKKGKFPAG